MTPLQQAQTWAASGFLDTLPPFIEYTLDNGTVIIQLYPKRGVLGNLDQLARLGISEKQRKQAIENLAEIVASIKHCIKEGIIN